MRTLAGVGIQSTGPAGQSRVMDGVGTNCTFSALTGIAVDNNRSLVYVSDPDVRVG